MRAGLGNSLIGLYKELNEHGKLSEDSLNTLLKDYAELALAGGIIDWKLLGVSDSKDQDGINNLLDYAEDNIARIGNALGTFLMILSVRLARTEGLSRNDLTQLLDIYNKFAPLFKTESGLVRSKTALTWELLGITPEGQKEVGKLLNYLKSQQRNAAIDQDALREFYNDLAILSGVEPMASRAEESPLPSSNLDEGRDVATVLSSRREEPAPATQSERNWGLLARIPFMEILLTVVAIAVGSALIEASLMLAGSVLLAVGIGAGAALMFFSSNRATTTQATTTAVAPGPEAWLESPGKGVVTVSTHASLNSPAPPKRASSGLAGHVGGDGEEEGDDLDFHH